MPTNRCSIKLSNPNTSVTTHEEATNEVRSVLATAYGADFLFEYDTWTQQMFIDHGISETIIPASGWDDSTKSVSIILETQQDINAFVNAFFSSEISTKVKTAWTENGWTLTEPEITVE